MGKGWDILQEWKDAQPIHVPNAQLAKALGVAQSNFDSWKNPKSLPSREALGAIARLTNRPYRDVLDAFLSDLGYDSAPTRAEIDAAQQKRKGHGRRVVADEPDVTRTASRQRPKERP